MIPISEFERRSMEGQLMKVDDFDVYLARKVRQLLKKYSVKYNPDELIVDDATADAVFNAAIEMLVEVGVYNVDTQRIIKWTTEEVNEMITDYKDHPRVFTLGKGKDALTIKPRTSKDTKAPVLWGAAWPIFNQETFIPFVQAFAQEEVVEGFSMAGGLGIVDGVTAQKGHPSEIYCSLWEVEAQTEALRRAGRPDMQRGMIPTATSLGAILASFGPGKLEPYNAMVGIHIMPEQKIDFERFNIAYVCEQQGIIPWTSAMGLVGGLCGGPVGSAVGGVANLLAQLSYGHGTWGSLTFNDMNGRFIDRETLWTMSAAHRAVERNLGLATATACVDSSLLSSYEEGVIGSVMMAISLTGSGGTINWYGGSTPLTHRIHADVMKQVAGMERKIVNDIMEKLSIKIVELVAQGQSNFKLSFNDQLFPAVYDVETLKPKQYYLEAVIRSVEIMKECGVPFSDKLILE